MGWICRATAPWWVNGWTLLFSLASLNMYSIYDYICNEYVRFTTWYEIAYPGAACPETSQGKGMQTEIQDSHSLDEICSQFSLPALLKYWIGHPYDHDWRHFIGHLLDLVKCYLVHPWGGRKDWIAFWSSTAVPEPGLVIPFTTYTTSNLKNKGTTWISGAMENKWFIMDT